jgi:uncharacterized damage-inducible protein DinB
MSVHALRAVIMRDLRALAREVEAYPDDETLWRSMPGVANAGGTLALHITGNLRHFLGAQLGGSAYVRNREAEFARRNLSRKELVAQVQAALTEVERTFEGLGDAQLGERFPEPIAGHPLDSDVFLIHLAAHLGYHLGQIDYHRRMTTGDGRTIDAMSIPELPKPR